MSDEAREAASEGEGDGASRAAGMGPDTYGDSFVRFRAFSTDEGPRQRLRVPVPQGLPYLVACLCTVSCSGGLILGVGPFGARLVKEGYVGWEHVGIIFTGAFQIMTWGSVMVVHLDSRVGPRFCAALGACLCLCGTAMLASIRAPASPYYVMGAYGLLGWGGNHIFITSYQFAQLFPRHVGLADGVLAGLFNAAGLVFLAFNAEGVTIRLFFRFWIAVVLCVLCLVLIFWPDRSYVVGDRARISVPTRKHIKRFFDLKIYTTHLHSILTLRYLLYAFSFAWSCLISTYIQGTLGVYHGVSEVGEVYLEWAFPLVANPTFLFSWIVGCLIDKSGFALVAFLLAFFCQVSLYCLHARSPAAAWLNLLLLNWISAIQYTVQFVFLHKALPHEAMPIGLVIVLVAQGLVGFVANPGLSPNPWGQDYLTPLLVLAVPSVLLFLWPAVEWRIRRKRRRRLEEARRAQEGVQAPSPPCSAFVHSATLLAAEEDLCPMSPLGN